MKSKEEFKRKYENGEFDEELKEAQSPEDIARIANELGYDLTVDDILNSELSSDALDLVAGGKGDTHNTTNHNNIIKGNSNTQITF